MRETRKNLSRDDRSDVVLTMVYSSESIDVVHSRLLPFFDRCGKVPDHSYCSWIILTLPWSPLPGGISEISSVLPELSLFLGQKPTASYPLLSTVLSTLKKYWAFPALHLLQPLFFSSESSTSTSSYRRKCVLDSQLRRQMVCHRIDVGFETPGSPFLFPAPSPPLAASSGPASQRTVTVDVPPTKTEVPPAATNSINDFEAPKEPKKSAFVGVSPEETLNMNPFENFKESKETESPKDSQFLNQGS
ncbi:unnamed protein product [Lactuca virosa]|uniref:Uncharacterized protein n=1 Tax=Lactuca virosa TaxID=75947 RepID=A0AAU9PSD5_9ASTR|nr:unnamed protein product [Lactuca virosa]